VRTGAVAVLAGAVGCGAAGMRVRGAPPTSTSTSTSTSVEDALAGDGEVFVRLDVVRGNPVGSRMGVVLGLWPGWHGTLEAIAADPLTDLDWVDVRGSGKATEHLIAVLSIPANGRDDADLDARLLALQARSAEPGASHVDGSMSAAAARLDGVLRVVFHPRAHVVAAAPVGLGPALSRELAEHVVLAPRTEPGEAVYADVVHPRGAMPWLPEEVERLRVRVLARPDGGAEASAQGDCGSADAADHAAAAVRALIARLNGPMVRMLTSDLLGGIVITTAASRVDAFIPASREQLEAILALVSARAR
jgi:hypothetical protein